MLILSGPFSTGAERWLRRHLTEISRKNLKEQINKKNDFELVCKAVLRYSKQLENNTFFLCKILLKVTLDMKNNPKTSPYPL